MRTIDYLPKHPEIKICQDDEMFRINTDTEVLGEFIEIYQKDIVLDFGTNNGALLLYASFFHPLKLLGLEINNKALELAKYNLDMNNITNYELINDDIITYSSTPVDVIICNPPYFKTEIEDHGKNYYKALAKHEKDLTLEKIITSVDRNLKENGTLFMLFLTSRIEEVFFELRKHHLHIKKIQFVYDVNKEYSNVFMFKAVKNSSPGLFAMKPIIIERGKKNV